MGFFGFKKIVKHNGEDVAVNIPNEVENEKVRKSFVCPYCNDTFVNNQGLGVHKLACEKNKVSKPVNKSTSNLQSPEIIQSLMMEFVSEAERPLEEGIDVEKEIETVNGERKKRTRGSKSRKAYSAQLKAKIVQKFEPGVTQEMIAEKYGISQSLISKWLKEKESIISASTNKNKTQQTKQTKKSNQVYRPVQVIAY